jgi:iron transport multicopper oxidase
MGPDQSNAAVSMGAQRNGVWGKPSIFGGDGGWLYATTFGRLDFYRRAVTAGRPGFSLCANTVTDQVGIGSSSPVVTSNKSDPDSALVWAVTMPFRDGHGAQLRVYRGNPTCGAELTSFREWAVGRGSRYASPGIGDGRIYVGTTDSHVIGYGSPAPDPVFATGTDLGVGVAGSSVNRSVALTASATLDVSSVTIEGDTNFSLVDPQPALPTHLADGETLTVPVRFTPTVPGMRGATLKVVTSMGEVRVSLNGKGRAVEPYLNVSTSIVSFGNVAQNKFQYQPMTLVNNGSQTLVISRFDVVNLVGKRIEPLNQSLPITIGPGSRLTTNFRYTAATAGAYSGELRMETNGSEPAANRRVQFSGFGARLGKLSIRPSQAIDFGRVKVGQTVTKTLTFRNLGEVPLVLNKYKPPAQGPFALSTQLDEGSRLGSLEVVALTLQFSPKSAGPVTRNMYVTATDSVGARVIVVKGVGIN